MHCAGDIDPYIDHPEDKCYDTGMNETKVITGHAQSEIIEKRSRFIANVYEIHSEEEALEILESVRKQYYDARHNCYAYVLGEHSETMRFSDDKEPQGTAGKPILEVLTRQGYHNTLIVVTRYFGGILLGAGGLLRAYTQAASEGLAQAEKEGSSSAVFHGRELSVVCSYNLSGKIQYMISQMLIPLSDTVYDAEVTFRLTIPDEQYDMFIRKVTEATNAQAKICEGARMSYILSEGVPLPYQF